MDESPEDVAPYVEGVSFPVLLDREHVLAELYAISNVPTVVWIDENGRIARPNGVAFGVDLFSEMTGIKAQDHMDEIRAWVSGGVVPIDVGAARAAVGDLSPDEEQARLLFRIGVHAHRTQRADDAERLFSEAARLAPHDIAIRRAAMPLRGVDPFGAEFFELLTEWQAAGEPYHGLPATKGDRDDD